MGAATRPRRDRTVQGPRWMLAAAAVLALAVIGTVVGLLVGGSTRRSGLTVVRSYRVPAGLDAAQSSGRYLMLSGPGCGGSSANTRLMRFDAATGRLTSLSCVHDVATQSFWFGDDGAALLAAPGRATAALLSPGGARTSLRTAGGAIFSATTAPAGTWAVGDFAHALRLCRLAVASPPACRRLPAGFRSFPRDVSVIAGGRVVALTSGPRLDVATTLTAFTTTGNGVSVARYALPHPESQPCANAQAAAPGDGSAWWMCQGVGTLRLSAGGRTLHALRGPSSSALSAGASVGPDGAVWVFAGDSRGGYDAWCYPPSGGRPRRYAVAESRTPGTAPPAFGIADGRIWELRGDRLDQLTTPGARS